MDDDTPDMRPTGYDADMNLATLRRQDPIRVVAFVVLASLALLAVAALLSAPIVAGVGFVAITGGILGLGIYAVVSFARGEY